MQRLIFLALFLASMLVLGRCAPTVNRAIETRINDILTLADENPGSNNKSNNSSCCSSDPKGSSNKSSNRSVNFDDFREDKGSLKKGGPSIEQLLKLKQFLSTRGIKFSVRQSPQWGNILVAWIYWTSGGICNFFKMFIFPYTDYEE